MAGNQLLFFATKSDIQSILQAVELKKKLKFTNAGLFDTEKIVFFDTLLDISSLGLSFYGDRNLDSSYLVANAEAPIVVRPVNQRRGGIKYTIDQLENPETIIFSPGGQFGSNILISGEVSTVSDSLIASELFKLFYKPIKHSFVKIKSYYVGKEAGELLDHQWRLTSGYKSPELYDLKR